MKRIMTLLFVLALLLPSVGCYHNQVIVQKDYNASATAPDYTEGFRMYLLSGLIPLADPVDADAVCAGKGFGIVEVEQTFVNGLINSVIGSLLSFQEVRVTCATGAGSAEAAPAEAPAEEMVEAPAAEEAPAADEAPAEEATEEAPAE